MSDRPNILWLSLEDTSPRFGCYGDDVAHARQISTNWRPRDVDIPMRFQRQVYVRRVARQLSRACIKRPLAHNTCERATPMPTRRKCPRPTTQYPRIM